MSDWISVHKELPKKPGWYRVVVPTTKGHFIKLKVKWEPQIIILGKRYEPGYFHEGKLKRKRPLVVIYWRKNER